MYTYFVLMNNENGRLIEVENYRTKTDSLDTRKQNVVLEVLREKAHDYGLDEDETWINEIENGKCINKFNI